MIFQLNTGPVGLGFHLMAQNLPECRCCPQDLRGTRFPLSPRSLNCPKTTLFKCSHQQKTGSGPTAPPRPPWATTSHAAGLWLKPGGSHILGNKLGRLVRVSPGGGLPVASEGASSQDRPKQG